MAGGNSKTDGISESDHPITRPTWWTDLVGEPSENRIAQPRRGGQHEEGPFEGGKLVLRVEPTRIDWLFTPIGQREPELEGIPPVGPFPHLLDAFLRVMRRWFELETCPPVQRLAFGAILLQRVEDRQTGYRQIAAYLPSIQLDPEGSSDFSYQINRPRESASGVSGLRINRLSKWSVASWLSQELSIRPESVRHSRGQPFFACRLEVDVNTAQDFQDELSRAQLPRIFQELVDLGQEIVNRGDIP